MPRADSKRKLGKKDADKGRNSSTQKRKLDEDQNMVVVKVNKNEDLDRDKKRKGKSRNQRPQNVIDYNEVILPTREEEEQMSAEFNEDGNRLVMTVQGHNDENEDGAISDEENMDEDDVESGVIVFKDTNNNATQSARQIANGTVTSMGKQPQADNEVQQGQGQKFDG